MKLLSQKELENGFVITSSGEYRLSESVTFEFRDGAPVPDACLDKLIGVPVFGIRIAANDVTLDLGGYAVRQSAWSVSRHRSFSCIGVTGKQVTIQNGTVGNSSDSCLWCSPGPIIINNLILRDFERVGVQCESMRGELAMSNCTIGKPSSTRRPSPETSLALRYRSALVASRSTYEPQLLALDDHATSGKSVRHEGALQAGVLFTADEAASSATVVISNVKVLELSLKIPRITFLSADGSITGVPRGPAEDPVSEIGASSIRRELQALPLGLGPSTNPSVEVAKLARIVAAAEISRLQNRPCLTAATNMPHCSSCYRHTQQPKKTAGRLRGFDATLRPIQNAAAILIRGATSYSLSSLTLATPNVKYETGGFRQGEVLILDQCGQGTLNSSRDVKPLLLRGTPIPSGDYCPSLSLNECPYNAAWGAGLPGGSTLSARPVGNVQNVQLVPAFQPYIMCSAST